jgi:hypothetical protein
LVFIETPFPMDNTPFPAESSTNGAVIERLSSESEPLDVITIPKSEKILPPESKKLPEQLNDEAVSENETLTLSAQSTLPTLESETALAAIGESKNATSRTKMRAMIKILLI